MIKRAVEVMRQHPLDCMPKLIAGSDEQSSEESNEKESPAPVTGAKHSTDPVSDPDKSKKGEGVAETMRISGTVDPGRPAR